MPIPKKNGKYGLDENMDDLFVLFIFFVVSWWVLLSGRKKSYLPAHLRIRDIKRAQSKKFKLWLFLDTDLWGKGGEFPYAKILPKWKGIYQEVGGHEVSETMMSSDVELKVRLCQFNVFRPSPLATYPKLVVQQLHKGRLFLSYLSCSSSEVAMTHWPLELNERSLTMCIEATTEWSRQTGVSDTGY